MTESQKAKNLTNRRQLIPQALAALLIASIEHRNDIIDNIQEIKEYLTNNTNI